MSNAADSASGVADAALDGAPADAVALQGRLTIAFAAEHCEHLRQWVDGGATAIDLSGVEDCDSAGVQLLLATARHARSHGLELSLRSPSAPLREVLGRYGLHDLVAG